MYELYLPRTAATCTRGDQLLSKSFDESYDHIILRIESTYYYVLSSNSCDRDASNEPSERPTRDRLGLWYA